MEERLIDENGLKKIKNHSKGENFNQTVNNIMEDLSKTFDNLNLENLNSETESEYYKSQRQSQLRIEEDQNNKFTDPEKMLRNFKKSDRPDIQQEYQAQMERNPKEKMKNTKREKLIYNHKIDSQKRPKLKTNNLTQFMSVTERNLYPLKRQSVQNSPRKQSRDSKQSIHSKEKNLDSIRLLKQFSRKDIDIQHTSNLKAMDKRLFGKSAKFFKSPPKNLKNENNKFRLPPKLDQGFLNKQNPLQRFSRTQSVLIEHNQKERFTGTNQNELNDLREHSRNVNNETLRGKDSNQNNFAEGRTLSSVNFYQRNKTWNGRQTSNLMNQKTLNYYPKNRKNLNQKMMSKTFNIGEGIKSKRKSPTPDQIRESYSISRHHKNRFQENMPNSQSATRQKYLNQYTGQNKIDSRMNQNFKLQNIKFQKNITRSNNTSRNASPITRKSQNLKSRLSTRSQNFRNGKREVSPYQTHGNNQKNFNTPQSFHRAETFPLNPLKSTSPQYKFQKQILMQNSKNPGDNQMNLGGSWISKNQGSLEFPQNEKDQTNINRKSMIDKKLPNLTNSGPNELKISRFDNKIYSQSQTQLPQPIQSFGSPENIQNRSASFTDIAYNSQFGINFHQKNYHMGNKNQFENNNFEIGQNMNRSILMTLENNSVGMEDMENRLILLFRKIIVFSSKIESLKRKIFKKNPEFSIYELFRQFAGQGALRIGEEGLIDLFANFDFHFSEIFVKKFILMLKGASSYISDSNIQNDVLGNIIYFYIIKCELIF